MRFLLVKPKSSIDDKTESCFCFALLKLCVCFDCVLIDFGLLNVKFRNRFNCARVWQKKTKKFAEGSEKRNNNRYFFFFHSSQHRFRWHRQSESTSIDSQSICECVCKWCKRARALSYTENQVRATFSVHLFSSTFNVSFISSVDFTHFLPR